MKSRLIWIVTLLVQWKLTGKSLNSIYMKSYQQSNVCHDLVKWLSHYLYFFPFFFFCFYLRLTTQKGVWESIMSQVSQGSHSVTSHECHIIGMGR